MQAITDGFAPVAGPAWRSWEGVMADVWDVDGLAGARGEYVSAHPRLFVVLDQDSHGAIQITPKDRTNAAPAQGRLSFIPAGMRTYSFVGEQTHLRHLDLHFDVDLPRGRLGDTIDIDKLNEPRLMFDQPRLLALASLMADECTGPGLHDLYGDSLVTAMLVELFEVGRVRHDKRGQLSPRRLRQAREFLEDNCLKPIRLQDLADLLDLSQSYLCSAFRVSTGVTPHQWLMRARIDRVKLMLKAPESRLSEVANATGFADQAHMTRVFKQYVGQTPAAWMRNHGGNPQGDR
jgi:AraC-like DNA-binding protein